MESIQVNGVEQGLTSRLRKYSTDQNFAKSNLIISDIGIHSINEAAIERLRQMKQLPLSSMQYLLSDYYAHVITNHKVTLLLHALEGISQKQWINSLEQELRSKYSCEFSRDKRIGDYFKYAYYLCTKYFFKYHRKHGCGILPLLKVNQFQFVKQITDTRNGYSHFLQHSQNSLQLEYGGDMVIFFYIIIYAMRLLIIDELGIPSNEQYIKEAYFAIHDWILDVKYDKKEPLKSESYKNALMRDEWARLLNIR